MPYYLNVKDNEIISYSELPVEECENITVSKLVFDDFSENRSKYYVQNGELKAKTAAQMLQEAEQEEKKHIAKMSMTKYDFFKYVCQPYGITYKQLVAAANSTDEQLMKWLQLGICALRFTAVTWFFVLILQNLFLRSQNTNLMKYLNNTERRVNKWATLFKITGILL